MQYSEAVLRTYNEYRQKTSLDRRANRRVDEEIASEITLSLDRAAEEERAILVDGR